MIRTAKQAGLEWEGAGLPEAPSAPDSLQESGLPLGFLNDLILRILYTRGSMVGLDMARFLCLPFKVIEDPLRFLKDEKCLEVTGGDLIGRVSYRFNLTDLGRKRAQDAMQMCGYVGPAPVPLEDYVEQAYRQAVTGISVSPENLRSHFSHLVLRDELFNAIGPAIVSGKSVFIYGPPGNGKTAIATAIGEFMTSAGGEVYVPYAFLAENSIVTVYDQAIHRTTADGKKFEVPFAQLIILSTNLDPRDLVDDAFLRRIRHKVEILAPARDVYERIFTMNAKRLGMNLCTEAVDFMYERYYNNNRSPRASDCRDLLEIVQSICRYRRQPVQLTRDLIAEAATTFISEF